MSYISAFLAPFSPSLIQQYPHSPSHRYRSPNRQRCFALLCIGDASPPSGDASPFSTLATLCLPLHWQRFTFLRTDDTLPPLHASDRSPPLCTGNHSLFLHHWPWWQGRYQQAPWSLSLYKTIQRLGFSTNYQHVSSR